jgi:hypothetical protein
MEHDRSPHRYSAAVDMQSMTLQTGEPRWPVAVAVAVVIMILSFLPGTVRILPLWVTWALGIALFAPSFLAKFLAGGGRWLRVERMTFRVFVVVAGFGSVANLVHVIVVVLGQADHYSGQQLFASSTAIWVTNVLVFSILFWRTDRGGPEARTDRAGGMSDWLFPQEGAPVEDVPTAWRPTFVDYLYLGFSTATAFSTTDVMPLTTRAKLLMMLESTISLVTIVVVVSRAINVLG